MKKQFQLTILENRTMTLPHNPPTYVTNGGSERFCLYSRDWIASYAFAVTVGGRYTPT